MFANLLQLFSRRPAVAGDEQAFVEEVRVPDARENRSRRSEWIIIGCWILIALKCWLVAWLMAAYHVPINPWWVVGPTLAAAAITTGLYLWRT